MWPAITRFGVIELVKEMLFFGTLMALFLLSSFLAVAVVVAV